jgi:hypothetical protein
MYKVVYILTHFKHKFNEINTNGIKRIYSKMSHSEVKKKVNGARGQL